MEEIEVKPKKIILNYGLLLGLVSVVFGIMLYTQKLHYEQSAMIISISLILTAAFIFLGVNAFKKSNEGYLKVGEALKIGVGIALVATIISLLYQYILITYIEPDFMDKAMEIAEVKAFKDNPSMTQEQWNTGMEMQKKFAWLSYPIGLIFSCITGLVFGLISGLIMKKANTSIQS